MRIRPEETFAGVPVLKVRGLLRSCWRITTATVQSCLNMEEQRAMVLLRDLENRGLIKRDEDGTYRKTEAGEVFAAAKANRPLRRKSAEKILAGFLRRVEDVRVDPAYLWRVRRVILFGSMTSDMPLVNGIDVIVLLDRKEPDSDRYLELASKSLEAALDAGRQLSTYESQAQWPHQKVYLHLKSRSSGLNIYRYWGEAPTLPGAREIYTHHDSSPGQRLLWEPPEKS